MNDALAREVEKGAAIIRQGGLVAFPTETYYGLAVNPYDHMALSRLFKVKNRNFDKPILTLIQDEGQTSLLASRVPCCYRPLMRTFWPGPLTLIFDGILTLDPLLTGDTQTVGMRISSNPVANALLTAVGKPITATSANISGRPATVNPREVEAQLGEDVDLIIDGGETAGGRSSTIVIGCAGQLRLIREGVISFRDIIKVHNQALS
ncbi:MAG: L-threonylcarbamoyladenylate synthase [Thermodesulfobacteriota bacterium]|nr:L-threonylcarbamoyladenylate synthase [Thermodesulfobacteriota bacterium]